MRFGESEKPNCHNCNCHKLGLDYLLSFLYQATECQAKFVVNSEGIAFKVEAFACRHRAEVRAVRAVVPAGDGDVLAYIDVRVALAIRRRDGLDEGEVIFVEEFITFDVATENTRIALAGLHIVVATQLCLQIHAQMRVVVPNFFSILLIHIFIYYRENSRPHTRAPPHNGEVRQAFGPTLDHFPR